VAIYVDSMHDRRTAYVFQLNAAGVQSDWLFYGDDQENSDWDAVWDGATAAIADGWSAEFVLPLSIFRFSPDAQQTWAIAVKRTLARTREELVSIQLRRGDRGVVAHFADLTGLSGLTPVQELSVAPYLASRLSVRPRYADDTILHLRDRHARVTDPSGDLGVDLRASLGRGLSLQASLNPDFGQVEADQLQQNLSSFELFFPEKRPFFTQGMDLFQGPTPHNEPSPQQLFYSRRIGLDGPILGATKVTGRITDELQIGLVQALVAGAAAPSGSTEDAPSPGYRFAGEQPLHFAPGGSLPAIAPATRNFLAGVARWQPAANASLGLSATDALPIGPACATAQANTSGDRPARCDALGGSAAAVDWNLRSADSTWFVRGQLSGSRYRSGEFTAQEDPVSGAPLGLAPRRVLADGTVLTPGDLGWGGFVALGRNGGEPWRFDVDLEYESPRLDLNAVGYQRTQNEARLRPVLRFVRPTGGGPFHEWSTLLGGELRTTTDGELRRRSAKLFGAFSGQLRGFHTFECELNYDFAGDDVREISQSGIAFGRTGSWSGGCDGTTDQSRAVYLELFAGGGRTLPLTPARTVSFTWAGGLISVRPHPSVETRLSLHYEQNAWPARWVESQGATQLFAGLQAPFYSVVLRQQLLLTPRLTLQVYGQLYVSTGRYGPYYTAATPAVERPDGARIRAADLAPGGTPSTVPDFHQTALNLSAVLRWEYRLGSTLYLVYSRAAAEAGLLDGERPSGALRPVGLGQGPITDTVLLKWSWYWAA
jgi:hypothetical protein